MNNVKNLLKHRINCLNLIVFISCVSIVILPSLANAAGKSHLGQKLKEHVTLYYIQDDDGNCRTNFQPPFDPSYVFKFVDMNAGGTVFSVPEDKELVITDIFWEATGDLAESVAELNIQEFDAITGLPEGGVKLEAAKAIGTTDNATFVADSVHIIAGIRINSGTVPCAIITKRTASGSRTFLEPVTVLMYGYLIKK
ncbi:MAG: hypothetical protein WBM41_13420 [Arenicellales bacterium]